MIGHDPDSGGHRIAQDVAYRPHQVSAVIYALDAYVRAAEIRESCQPFFVLSDELPAAALLSSDDKVYVVAHQAERKYRHLIPYCTYRNAVHAVPDRRYKYANDFPYCKANQDSDLCKHLIFSFLPKW